jgi:hypothetical protein
VDTPVSFPRLPLGLRGLQALAPLYVSKKKKIKYKY